MNKITFEQIPDPMSRHNLNVNDVKRLRRIFMSICSGGSRGYTISEIESEKVIEKSLSHTQISYLNDISVTNSSPPQIMHALYIRL